MIFTLLNWCFYQISLQIMMMHITLLSLQSLLMYFVFVCMR